MIRCWLGVQLMADNIAIRCAGDRLSVVICAPGTVSAA